MESEKLIIFDTTLRDGEQCPGASLNIAEKLEIARQLALLKVDVIEAGFPAASPGDFESVKQIADEIRGASIAGLARALDKDIEAAARALEKAARPRIHVFLSTSKIHRKHMVQKAKAEIIDMAVKSVGFARQFCDDVEFSPMDASRTESEFLVEVLGAVIDAGASTLNIPDTVGYSIPGEFAQLITHLKENVSVHCHNDLGLAVANSLAAVQAGARQVECTVNGIGERAGNASMEEVVMNIATRGDFFHFHTGVNTREIYRASKLVSSITGSRVQANKAIVGANAFAHEAGIHQDGVLKARETYEIMLAEDVGWTGESMVMGKHSGRHALGKPYERFKVLCDKKKVIYDADLHAIVADEISDVKKVYELSSVQIASGTTTVPTATVKLLVKGKSKMEAACGDGPVDAICKAIDRIVGTDFQIESYDLGAVTQGQDALGEVTIRLSDGKNAAVGRGASTDIVLASAKAR